jgi:hypothetical protein
MRAGATALVWGLLATSAAAWSPPATLLPDLPARCFHNGSTPDYCVRVADPSVSVNARGEVLVAWTTQSRLRFAVHAAIARRDGRFGAPQTIGTGLRPAPRMRDDGTALVVWTGPRGLRYATWGGHGHFGPAHRLTSGTDRGSSADDFSRLLAQPDGGALLVYQHEIRSSFGIRAISMPRHGRPGPVRRVARGELRAAAGAPDGSAVVCCARGGAVLRRPANGAWSTAAPPTGDVVESLAAADDGYAAGLEDRPNHVIAATRGPWDGPLGDPMSAPVDAGSAAFFPTVGIGGDGGLLLAYVDNPYDGAYQYGPLYAVAAAGGGAFGPRVRLDGGQAWGPVTAPLADGTLLAWSSGDRWHMARVRGTAIAATPPPAGGPGVLWEQDALATAGPYAAVAWESERGAVRASVARYD